MNKCTCGNSPRKSCNLCVIHHPEQPSGEGGMVKREKYLLSEISRLEKEMDEQMNLAINATAPKAVDVEALAQQAFKENIHKTCTGTATILDCFKWLQEQGYLSK